MGRGKIQANATKELKSLFENFPYREIVLELVYGLWDTLRQNQENSDKLEAAEAIAASRQRR